MTEADEAEWLNGSNPDAMLKRIERRATDRKLRLLAVAFCRSIWQRIPNEPAKRALELSEQFADGNGSERTFARARRAAYSAAANERTASFLSFLPAIHAWNASRPAIRNGLKIMVNSIDGSGFCGFLRDIFPFRPVTIDSALLTWRDRTIPKLAQAAYDERELPSGHLGTKRLAILADALEEAGCTNEDVLTHLRGAGPHVRGCWVVDLLLGKE